MKRKAYVRLLVLATICLLTLGLSAAAMDFNEAPELKALVESGQLPPVEERLPLLEDVLVVDPVERVGKYGGIARAATTVPTHAGGDILMSDFRTW